MEEKKVKDKGEVVVKNTVVATLPPTEVVKQLTVKERINSTVESVTEHGQINEIELKAKLFQLFQRILHPEQFCPKCDERMFFSLAGNSYSCPNCDYQVKVNATLTSAPTARQTGSVPPQVEKLLEQAKESMKETPVLRKGSMGDKIRKLVDQRDTGSSAPPTAEDEARIKSSDKNASQKINWI